MRITYRLRLDDLIAYSDRVSAPRAARTRRRSLLVGAVYGVLAVVFATQTDATIAPLVLGAFALAWPLGWPAVARAIRHRAIRKMVEGSGRLGEWEAHADEAHLDLHGAGGARGQIPWDTVDRVEPTEGLLCLYRDGAAALVIARDAVVDGDFDAFVEACRVRAAKTRIDRA